MNNEYQIKNTINYTDLDEFFLENNIEIGNEVVERKIIKAWKVINKEKNIIAGITLGEREGFYIVDAVAVDNRYRGKGIASNLMNLLINECKKYKIKKLYIVAKEPEFFRVHKFLNIDFEKSPKIFGCNNCDIRNISCFPETMYREL